MTEPFEARILIVSPDGIGLVADVSYKTIKHIYSDPPFLRHGYDHPWKAC